MGSSCSISKKSRYNQPQKIMVKHDSFGKLLEQYEFKKSSEVIHPISRHHNFEIPIQKKSSSFGSGNNQNNGTQIAVTFRNSEHAQKLFALHKKGTKDILKLAEDFLARIQKLASIKRNMSARFIQQLWRKWRNSIKEKAATKIQSVYRGHQVRRNYLLQVSISDEFAF